jgi:hypothetical protein
MKSCLAALAFSAVLDTFTTSLCGSACSRSLSWLSRVVPRQQGPENGAAFAGISQLLGLDEQVIRLNKLGRFPLGQVYSKPHFSLSQTPSFIQAHEVISTPNHINSLPLPAIMKLFSFILALAMGKGSLSLTYNNPTCNANNCARGVTGSRSGKVPDITSRASDCSSFMVVTVTPATSLVLIPYPSQLYRPF